MKKTKYPTPDRGDRSIQPDYKNKSFPEIDIGGGFGLLNDGRPYKIEYWSDIDCEVNCITYFYSSEGIENWHGDDHISYLEQLKFRELLTGEYKNTGPDPKIISDKSGNKMWSVTFVSKDYQKYLTQNNAYVLNSLELSN